MISQLTGTIVSAGATWFVIDVQGVGYHATTTPAAAAALRPGEAATVHTSLVLRQDSLSLFAFLNADERHAFELVQTASGVGPKLAVAVVSVLGAAELRRAVLAEDLNRLCTVPGIGRKGAQKLVLELKDKVLLLAVEDEPQASVAPQPDPELWRSQVVDGLQSLGWSARDAGAACDAVAHLVEEDPGVGVGVLMRAALNTLARR